MPIIDSHCHASLVWFEPVETLLHEMDRIVIEHLGVTGAADQSDVAVATRGRVLDLARCPNVAIKVPGLFGGTAAAYFPMRNRIASG